MNRKCCYFIVFLLIQSQISFAKANDAEELPADSDDVENGYSQSFSDDLIEGEGEEDAPQKPLHEFEVVSLEKFGKIKGFLERSSSGVPFYSYLGIPYAKPPIGSLRFKDPEGLEEWEGVRDGSIAPPPCSQFDINTFIKQPKSKYVGEEDCLYLNVFTPEPNNPDANLPVLVYIHGGHFVSGSASDYEPYDLLDAPIVLVVMQYRLGVLGFLSTEDLTIPGNFGLKDQTLALKWVHKYIEDFGGSPLKITVFGSDAGAASVHYQMLSHKTIGLFNKAILQSGSALCPWARGAAHKDVAYHIGKYFKCFPEEENEDEEKKDEGEESVEKEEEKEKSDDEAEKKEEIERKPEESEEDIDKNEEKEETDKEGKEETDEEEKEEKKEEENSEKDEEEIRAKNENLLQCLRNIDAEKLALSAELFYMWSYFPVMFGPYADERYLPETPESLLKNGRHKRVPIIIGFNKNDGSHIANSLFMSEGRRMALKHHFPLVGPISLEFSDEDVAPLNMSIKAYDKYVGNLDIDAPDATNISKLYTDRHFAVCSDVTAEYHAMNNKKYKKDVFFYVFEHRGERSNGDAFGLNIGNDWVSHGDELYYLFPFNKTKEHFRNEEDMKMKKLFVRMWYSFAEHGNPTPNGTFDFTWSPYTVENRSRLRLSQEPVMKDDNLSEEREFWTTLPTSQNIFLHKEYFVKLLNMSKKEEKGEEAEEKPSLKEGEERKKEEAINEETKKNEGESGRKEEEEGRRKEETSEESGESNVKEDEKEEIEEITENDSKKDEL